MLTHFDPTAINPTQMVGILVTLAAALSCGVIWRRRPWRWISLCWVFFAAEIIVGLRHSIHDMFGATLRNSGGYAERQGMQWVLLGFAVLGIVGALWFALRSHVHPMLRLAMLATMGMAGLFALEMVSVHAIDAILYAMLGPFRLIVIPWVLLSSVTVVAAIGYSRNDQRSAWRQ